MRIDKTYKPLYCYPITKIKKKTKTETVAGPIIIDIPRSPGCVEISSMIQ